MRYPPVLYSLGMHAAVLAAAAVGLPQWFRPEPLVTPPMVVELVRIEEETRIVEEPVEAPKPVIAKPKPEPEPVKESHSVRETPPPPPPPEPVLVQEEQPPLPEPVPEPVVVEKKPPPKPVEPKKIAALPPPVAKPEPKPKPKPKPVVEPKPKPKPKPVVEKVKPRKPIKTFAKVPTPRTKPRQRTFDAMRIATLLNKSDPEPEAKGTKNAKEHAKKEQPVQLSARAKFGQEMSINEIAAIRRQVEKCWSVPSGARGAEDLRVTIRFSLNRDGSLATRPVIEDRARMARIGQENFRSAAESVQRAINRCQPFEGLPADKYDTWRDIKMNFDPKEMLGG